MRREVWVLIVVSIVYVFFGSLTKASAQASDPHLWDGNITLEQSKTITPTQVQNRHDCRYVNAKSISLKTPFTYMFATVPVMLNPTTTTIGNRCIIDNQNGYFTNEFLQGSGDSYLASYYFGDSTDKMYDLAPMLSGNYWIEPASNSNTVLFLVKNAFTDKTYSVNTQNDIGDARPGIRSNKLTWEFGNLQPETWRDKDGVVFKIDEHVFSPNGQFMAIHYKSTIAKVNLRNMEMMPVAYDTSLKGSELAISNDGRYVAQLKSSKLFVTDTYGCETVYNSDSWDIISGQLSYPGCKQSQDIIPGLVSGGLISSGKFYKRPYFSPDSKKLNIAVGTRRTDINTGGSMIPLAFNWQEVVLTANNHVSNVQGYLAMGDSFSSGEGDLQGGTWYEPGTDEQGNKDTFEGRNLCHLSRRSYPYLIAKELGYLSGDASEPTTPLDNDLFHSVACSGAVIHNIVGTTNEDNFDHENSSNQYRNDFLGSLVRWQPGRIKQLDALDSFVFGGYSVSEPKPEVITLGIGGNDGGFGDIVKSCTLPGTCKYAVEQSIDLSNLAIGLMKIKPKLVDTYKKIKQTSPESRIYVHGYPIFVSDRVGDLSDSLDGGTCRANVRLDFQERRLVVEGIKYMNEIVRAAASEAGVFYVDIEDILEGTNLCSGHNPGDITVNGVTAGNDIDFSLCLFRTGCIGSESFHPNQLAHRLYKERVLSYTGNLSEPMPPVVLTSIPAPDDFFGSTASSQAGVHNNGGNFTIVVPEPKPFLSGSEQGSKILQEGLLPGSILRVELQSTPITIADFTVPADGVVNQPIELQSDSEPGAHELHIFGVDNFGTAFDYYEPILIAFSETDFDGDGITDDVDSCITVFDSFVDVDQDGIDDVCDGEIVITPPEPEVIIVPPEEIIVEDPITEEETSPETPTPQVLDREKGEPNPETVAGDEETVPQVLGASTSSDNTPLESQSVLGAAADLASTGKPAIVTFFVGITFVIIGIVLYKHQK